MARRRGTHNAVIEGTTASLIQYLTTGDPVTAASAAGLAASIRYVGDEFRNRLLAPREIQRVGIAITVIHKGISARRINGREVRQDGFFDRLEQGSLSRAEEVAEDIVARCQREPEERKVPYVANLFAEIAFQPTVSADMAHQLARYADELTYRQFCILCIASTGRFRAMLRQNDYRGEGGEFGLELLQLLYELADLEKKGLVRSAEGTILGAGLTDVIPGRMRAQGLGVHLAQFTGLAHIPDGDLLPLARQLR